MRRANLLISIRSLMLLMFIVACKSPKKEPVPGYVVELLGTYRSQSEHEFIGGTSQTELTQMEITKSASKVNSVDLSYIRVIRRFNGATESPKDGQTWGPLSFKNVDVSETGTIDHKETQITNFGGQPGNAVQTILSIKGGVVGNTLTIIFGTDYPSKNLFNNTLMWLEKVN